jgi:hypothetical protein
MKAGARLEFARDEVDLVFGGGYAVEHPDVVSAVMLSASLDWAAQLIAAAASMTVRRKRRPKAGQCGRCRCRVNPFVRSLAGGREDRTIGSGTARAPMVRVSATTATWP